MDPGTILFHKQFAFRDGAVADKLLVVLGADPAHLLVAKTTSQGARYRNDHGCQAGNRFPAFLLTKGCCFLSKPTWVCLSEFYELLIPPLHKKMAATDVYRLGVLPKDITLDVQVCAAGSYDILQAQEALVRSCFVKP